MNKGPLIVGGLVIISLIFGLISFIRSHPAVDVFAYFFIGLSLLSLVFMIIYVKAEAAV